jgi:hypothetical protein
MVGRDHLVMLDTYSVQMAPVVVDREKGARAR